MRGDAAGQGEDGLEPVDLGVGVAGDLFPATARQVTGDGYEDDLVESVDSPLLAPGVRQLGEVVEERGRSWRVGEDEVSRLRSWGMSLKR